MGRRIVMMGGLVNSKLRIFVCRAIYIALLPLEIGMFLEVEGIHRHIQSDELHESEVDGLEYETENRPRKHEPLYHIGSLLLTIGIWQTTHNVCLVIQARARAQAQAHSNPLPEAEGRTPLLKEAVKRMRRAS